MNRYYFKNKNKPDKVCYELYGIDPLTEIRYSLALCGTRKAAEEALTHYLYHICPSDHDYNNVPDYEGILSVGKTTIRDYQTNRQVEITKRYRLRSAYQNEISGIDCHQDEIIANVKACAECKVCQDPIEREHQIGDNSEMDALERQENSIITYRVIKRPLDNDRIELVFEINFKQSKNNHYEYNSDIPDAPTQIQQQTAVLFRGNEDGLKVFLANRRFDDVIMGNLYQAIRNHYYGFPPAHYLFKSPVYKDSERTADEFHFCFMGFLTAPGHYDYMPTGQKIWFD